MATNQQPEPTHQNFLAAAKALDDVVATELEFKSLIAESVSLMTFVGEVAKLEIGKSILEVLFYKRASATRDFETWALGQILELIEPLKEADLVEIDPDFAKMTIARFIQNANQDIQSLKLSTLKRVMSISRMLEDPSEELVQIFISSELVDEAGYFSVFREIAIETLLSLGSVDEAVVIVEAAERISEEVSIQTEVSDDLVDLVYKAAAATSDVSQQPKKRRAGIRMPTTSPTNKRRGLGR